MGLLVRRWAFASTVLAVASGTVNANEDPIVTTNSGQLRGTRIKSFLGNEILAFKGIPYAEPPLDELRFQLPRPHPGWTGVRKAHEHGNKCIQYNMFFPDKIEGDEDCLFLNVYTPRLPSDGVPSSLPVMVWIHGGAFINGDGDVDLYGPGYLLDQQVVLVTINYRLNVFGFLTTGDAEASGNYGMHDQVLALHWVKQNIVAFGGDPEVVTIFGESAGAAGVGLHMLSPRSSGLFARAISQSGASFCPFGASGAAQGENAKRHAELLGCDTSSSQAIVRCIRQLPAMKIMETMQDVLTDVMMLAVLYKPRVDSEAKIPFLPEDPFICLQEGRFNRVPWLNGFNADEGAFFVAMWKLSGKGDILKQKDWNTWAKLVLELDGTTNSPAETAQQVYRYYYGEADITDNNLKSVVDMVTDRMFTCCITSETELASAHAPVYTYLLDHRDPGRQSTAAILGGLLGTQNVLDLGVSHIEDLFYLFQTAIAPPIAVDSVEHKMVRLMVSLWTSFAHHGVPSTDVVAMPSWPVFTMEKKQHMRLSLSPSVDSDVFGDRARFWRQLNIRENWRKSLNGNSKDEL